jgi:hypothetical protein
MALLFPNNGEGDALQYLVNRAAPENLVLRLYTSNTTPAEADTAGTYTEATGFGYAALTLTGASWGAPSEGAPSSIAYAQQTFTFTGALGNVYGYYLTRATSGRIAYSERFSDGPYNIVNNGDQIKITPTITCD